MEEYYTDDGELVEIGLDVFTSDCRWGKVTIVANWPSNSPSYPEDVWHQVQYPDGRKGNYNQSRLSTVDRISGTTRTDCVLDSKGA